MNVKRYNQEYYHSGDESTLDEAPDGEWVRWDEVEPLLIDRVAAQERHRRYADGIAAAIGERPTRNTGEPAYSDWEEVIRIKAEREDARAVAFHAFVQGAKWWQFAGNGSTALPSEQDEMVAEAFPSEHAEMVAEAERRYPFAPHPLVMAAAAERDEARTLLRELLDCKVWDSGLPGCFSLIVPELMYALIEKAVEVKP